MPPIYITFLNRLDIEELALSNEEILAAIETSLAAQGRGQTVGILAFNEFEGGYSASALQSFFQEVLRAAPPEMVDVVVHGRGNTPSGSREKRSGRGSSNTRITILSAWRLRSSSSKSGAAP